MEGVVKPRKNVVSFESSLGASYMKGKKRIGGGGGKAEGYSMHPLLIDYTMYQKGDPTISLLAPADTSTHKPKSTAKKKKTKTTKS